MPVAILLRYLVLFSTLIVSAVPQTVRAAPTPPKIFRFGGMYSTDSGNPEPGLTAPPGYNPVPELWRDDPMVNGEPSRRARLTYRWQQSGATAVPPRAWRAFLVHQHAAPVIGGEAANAHDIAYTLAWLQAQSYPIDYVFADLEG